MLILCGKDMGLCDAETSSIISFSLSSINSHSPPSLPSHPHHLSSLLLDYPRVVSSLSEKGSGIRQTHGPGRGRERCRRARWEGAKELEEEEVAEGALEFRQQSAN